MIGLPVALAGCQTAAPPGVEVSAGPVIDQSYVAMYGPITTEPFPVEAVNLKQIDPKFYRQVVQIPYDFPVEPGTIVIDPYAHFLYLVFENGTAIRYGVGVGRDGFQWQGLQKVSRKQEWPDWRPPPEMIQRQPYLPRFMAGGPGNPMGARALYLGDTVYRIHGTNQPQTIGYAVSSGCFRLVNRDVIDLFNRVPVGTKVVILQSAKL